MVWIEGVHRLVRDPQSGKPTGSVASLRDVTSRKAIEQELLEKTLLLDRTLENMDQGLLMIDASGKLKVYNQRAAKLLDLPDEFLRSQPTFVEIFEYLMERDEYGRTPTKLLKELRSGLKDQPYHVYERERPDGMILEVRTVRLTDGSAVRTIADITARKQAERRAEHMAKHDALTALPNRRAFQDRLGKTLRAGRACAVLCLDLDRFKAVNDTFGHHAGDVLLKTISDRIGSTLNLGDFAARIGGDEFAVILNDVGDGQRASVVAERLIQAICRPCNHIGNGMHIGLSIGVAVTNSSKVDSEQVVKNADLALYRAKAAGRNTYRIYDPAMDQANEDRLLLEFDLNRALAARQFLLHYQPCVDTATGEFAGFEALLRWDHPLRGLISPTVFIPLAEEMGVIIPIGIWVLNEACRAAARWPDHLRIAVNVSVVQFRQDGLEQAVLAALAASGLAPHRLELEVTESVLMHESDGVLVRLNRLRALGVRIALDDFGTGYSSLSYLHKFQFDRIKIDKSFIQQIDTPDASAIVHAIVALGRHRSCSITAEGVEKWHQFDRVVEAGCTEVQDYLYSKPIAGEKIADMLGLKARQPEEKSPRPIRAKAIPA